MSRIPLSYVVFAVFVAATVVTSNLDYFLSSQFKATDVEATNSTNVVANDDSDGAADGIDGVAQSESTKNKTLSEERWNLLKQMSCPKQVPNQSIWPTLFTQARIELGFDMDSIPNTPKDIDFVNDFFTFCKGGVGYTSLDGEHHLVYLKIWKSANDQIRKNINLVARKKDNLWDFDMGMNLINSQRNRDYSELWSPIPLSKRNQTCVVTAVRDPVEHFLSAYNEIEFRSTDSWLRTHGVNTHNKPQRYYERYENGTDARFERYVSEFIFGASSTELFPSIPPSNIYHAFSQTGVLWLLEQQKALMGVNAPQLVAYLPSISNISATLPNLVTTNCPGFEEEFGRRFNKQFDHPSQKDEQGFYAAAKRVWSKQDATSRALCALHLLDYACFDLIPVPNLCQDVFADESFNDRLRSATATTPLKDVANPCKFCEGGIAVLSKLVPRSGGLTCELVRVAAIREVNGSESCVIVQKEEEVCCPTEQVGDSN
mmetsp:Transcript_30319/g.47486  ORF Transcript_30319/g.47486 Transcript_30319/m.47486 type:complete len:487 (-) Transcript_30319:33-1493(-)